MNANQYRYFALVGAAVGAAVALGDVVASRLNGRPTGALDVLVCCILAALVTAKVVVASQRA